MNQLKSVEFSVIGCAFVYQFKIWDISLKEKRVVVTQDSDLLNYLEVGDILNLKYYTTDFLSPVARLRTEIRQINKGDKRGSKGVCLVDLSILESQDFDND